MRIETIGGLVAVALLATACGTNQEQRSATGALTGAGIGALAGGPIGLVIGGLAGGAAGAATPVGADQVAFYGMDKLDNVAESTPVMRDMTHEGVSGSSTPGNMARTGAGGSDAHAATLHVSQDTVKQMQSSLKAHGLYNGPIDGIVGPQTNQALAAYRQKQGLPQTAVLDSRTLQNLTSDAGKQTNNSGSSTSPGSAGANQGGSTGDNR
jgi:hypothetical protein